jgi:hypothetical protein
MGDAPDSPEPIRDLRELLRNSYRFLGYSELVIRLGVPDQQVYGKWCARCQGIWFGLALEVECPLCGNRKG